MKIGSLAGGTLLPKVAPECLMLIIIEYLHWIRAVFVEGSINSCIAISSGCSPTDCPWCFFSFIFLIYLS